VAWIDQLAVLPAHCGAGVGAALLAHALEALPRPLRLYTFQANRHARAFYERQGFVAVQFTDGAGNEERCPDVLYELGTTVRSPP
jgi:GNAT superfamily N-acetyltransferase